MLATFLGEKSFRQGLNAYLNKFKYSNAKTKDLWASLSEVCLVCYFTTYCLFEEWSFFLNEWLY